MKLRLFAFALIVAALSASCGTPKPHHTKAQVEQATGVAQCKVVKDVQRPMLVEWPATEKAALQTNADRGVVVVRYDGCRLKMLDRCQLAGAYEFNETSRSRDGFKIRDRSELFAKLPLGAVSLEGKLQQGTGLSLAYVAVGTKTAGVTDVQTDQLTGACDGATHYVRSMVVGAYELASEKLTAGGASVEVGPAGAGGSREKRSEVLRADGDMAACADAATPGVDRRCQAIVQLVLEPIRDAGPAPPAVPRERLPSLAVQDLLIEVGFSKPVAFYIVSRMSPPVDDKIAFHLPARASGLWKKNAAASRKLGSLTRKRRDQLRALDERCATPSKECPSQETFEKQRARIERTFKARIGRAEKQLAGARSKAQAELERVLAQPGLGEPVEAAAHFALGQIEYELSYERYLEANDRYAEAMDRGDVVDDAPPEKDLSVAEEHYRAAVTRTSCSQDLGWWARYLLAYSLNESMEWERSGELYMELGGCAWRKESAEVLFGWAETVFDSDLRPGAMHRALQAYNMAAEAAASLGDDSMELRANYKAMWAAYLDWQNKLALMHAARVLATASGDDAGLSGDALSITLGCVERAGGLANVALEDFDERSVARLLDLFATQAFERGLITEAGPAWMQLLEKVPDALEAPRAMAGLIAIARLRGDNELAESLVVRRAREYGSSSPWAQRLREARTADGEPTDKQIIEAANHAGPSPPSRPQSDQQTQAMFARRTGRLFKLCRFFDADHAGAQLKIDVAVYMDGGTELTGEVVCVEGNQGGGCLPAPDYNPRAMECLRRNGPRYYSGLPRSIVAAVKLVPGQ